MEHKVDLLSRRILENVRQFLDAEDENDTSKDSIINTMSNEEIFDAWCNYEGLINHASLLQSVVENIWQIKLEEK